MEDSDEEGWTECAEDGEESLPKAHCLFCEETFPSAEKTFTHCKAQHQFNIFIVQKLFSLDFYGYIKMVNYIRKSVSVNVKP